MSPIRPIRRDSGWRRSRRVRPGTSRAACAVWCGTKWTFGPSCGHVSRYQLQKPCCLRRPSTSSCPMNGRALPRVRDTVDDLGRPVLGRLDGDGDGVDVVGRESGDGETARDGLLGKRPRVLLAREPLFLDGDHDLAVDHDAGRGVVEVVVEPEDVHASLPLDRRPAVSAQTIVARYRGCTCPAASRPGDRRTRPARCGSSRHRQGDSRRRASSPRVRWHTIGRRGTGRPRERRRRGHVRHPPHPESLRRRVAAYVASNEVLAPASVRSCCSRAAPTPWRCSTSSAGSTASSGWASTLRALHVDYRTRGAASDRDREIVARACAAAGVPLETVRLARQARGRPTSRSGRDGCATRPPRASSRPADADVIVTGHNRDDQAETVLYRLAKYAAPSSLVGMRPREGDAGAAAPLPGGRGDPRLLRCGRHRLRRRREQRRRSPTRAIAFATRCCRPWRASTRGGRHAGRLRRGGGARALRARRGRRRSLAGRSVLPAVEPTSWRRSTCAALAAEAEALRRLCLRRLLARGLRPRGARRPPHDGGARAPRVDDARQRPRSRCAAASRRGASTGGWRSGGGRARTRARPPPSRRAPAVEFCGRRFRAERWSPGRALLARPARSVARRRTARRHGRRCATRAAATAFGRWAWREPCWSAAFWRGARCRAGASAGGRCAESGRTRSSGSVPGRISESCRVTATTRVHAAHPRGGDLSEPIGDVLVSREELQSEGRRDRRRHLERLRRQGPRPGRRAQGGGVLPRRPGARDHRAPARSTSWP